MDVDCENATEITAYLETWFDVDKKFGTNTKDDDDVWLNVYAKYNPFDDTLRIECEIDKPKGSEYFEDGVMKRASLIILAAITFLLPFAAFFVSSGRVMTSQNA